MISIEVAPGATKRMSSTLCCACALGGACMRFAYAQTFHPSMGGVSGTVGTVCTFDDEMVGTD